MVKFGLCTLVGAQSHPTLQPHGLYVACQAPLSMGISQQEYWSCHFLLQRIFLTRDQTQVSCISCIGRHILYDCAI